MFIEFDELFESDRLRSLSLSRLELLLERPEILLLLVLLLPPVDVELDLVGDLRVLLSLRSFLGFFELSADG